MNGWIQIDPDQINTPRRETISGVSVTVFSAPYDVPKAVRAYFDRPSNQVVLEFRYSGDEVETLESRCVAEGCIYYGRQSGRLYRIELDANHTRSQAAGGLEGVRKANQTLDGILKKTIAAPRASRMDNYFAAKKALELVQPRLEQEFSLAH